MSNTFMQVSKANSVGPTCRISHNHRRAMESLEEEKQSPVSEGPSVNSERSRLVPPPLTNSSPSYLNLCSNICAINVFAILTYCCFRDGSTLFSYHPIFMTVGWLLFMPLAINAITPGDLATEWMPIRLRSARHWVLQVTACTLAIVGFLIIMSNKIRNNSSHFTSTHGKFGLASLILMSGTITGGLCALYSLKLKHILAPIYTKWIHGCAGLITFSCGIVTMILGLFSSWWDDHQFGETLRYILLVLILTVLLFTILRPSLKMYFRIKERIEAAN